MSNPGDNPRASCCRPPAAAAQIIRSRAGATQFGKSRAAEQIGGSRAPEHKVGDDAT
jgi:hypothetical protein